MIRPHFILLLLILTTFLYSFSDDFFFKTSLDRFFYFLFSYFWTNSYFLLMLLFGPCLIFSYFSLGRLFFSVPFLLLFFETTNTNLLHHFLFNVDADSLHFENFLLQNSLNFIHPPFFFFLVFLSFSLFFFNQKLQFYTTTSSLIFNLIFIFLGGWWAFQETNWGGWWNWDPSENLSLLFFSNSMLFFHIAFFTFSYRYFIYHSISWIVFFLIFFFLLQLSYTSSAHSFGLEFFFLFSSDLLYVIFITTLFIILLSLMIELKLFFYFITSSNKINFFWWSLVSFLSFLFWQYYTINGWFTNWENNIFVTETLLLLFFSNFSFFSCYIPAINTIASSSPFFLLIIPIPFLVVLIQLSKLRIMHLFLFWGAFGLFFIKNFQNLFHFSFLVLPPLTLEFPLYLLTDWLLQINFYLFNVDFFYSLHFIMLFLFLLFLIFNVF
uniref:Heme maturase n=1 Tax=Bakuella subtropica TaxID=1295181 RepID=UPI0023F3B7CD|nr:Heme maturase [Bakuella subtropica]WDY80867.1 Heme maturase [Bakuella subtropica]